MSGFKHFAIAGAGNIGTFIVEELLKLKAEGTVSSVAILSRSGSGQDKLAAEGADIVKVDYSDTDTLTATLKGVDVVISTLPPTALDMQDVLAQVAKAAGVKLFVPSEFGDPTEGLTHGMFGVKDGLRLGLKKMGLHYAVFYTGPFPDFIFIPPLGFDLPNGKVNLVGEGNTPISFTSRKDIATYVAYALTSLPLSKVQDRTFRIEGDRQTFNGVLEQYQARTGRKLEITHSSVADAKAAVEKDPEGQWINGLLVEWEEGRGVSGTEDELTNAEVPDWKPKKVIDVLLQ